MGPTNTPSFDHPTLDRLGDCVFLQLPHNYLPTELPPPTAVVGSIAVDTETSGLHPDSGARVSVISLAFQVAPDYSPRDEVLSDLLRQARETGLRVYWSAAFPFGQGPEGDVHCLPKVEWNSLIAWLRMAGGGLYGHNTKFDLVQLAGRSMRGWRGHDLTDRLVYDTMVGAFEADPKGPLALKKIGVQLFHEDADAEQKALGPFLGPKANPRYDQVPWLTMFPYARRDAELTAAVFEDQWDWFDECTPMGGWLGQEMDTLRALTRMELAGLPFAVDQAESAAQVLRDEIARIGASLPFRPTPVGSRKWFYEDPEGPGLVPTDFTATGNPSASASVVRRLAQQGVPHAAELEVYNRYKSALSKWYDPFPQRAGSDRRLRTSFRHTGGTKSGRLSSTRINLQAVPQDYALHLPVPTPRQLVAREIHDRYPGWQLWELDLQQAELRLAAMDAGVEPMLDMLLEGRDVHGETATRLFGVDPDSDDWPHYRGLAKRANFSLIFGAGPKTFHQSLVDSGDAIPYREVQDLVYGWRDLYPQFLQAIERDMAFCDQFGYVETTTGRRRHYSFGEDSHSSFNQRIQGSLAEFAKAWTISTDRFLRPFLTRGLQAGIGRAGLLLTVHDSQVLLLPDEYADEVVQQVTEQAGVLWSEFFPGVPGGADADRWA